MRQKYLDYLTIPVPHDDGNIRPRLRGSERWKSIEDNSINDSFIDILEAINSGRKVWIWSDHHFYHKNVIKYSNRPYKDVEDMNQQLIDTYNEIVGEDDICIFAGDVTFKSTTLFREEILPKLNKGYKILVIGNHDFDKKKVRNLGFDENLLVLEFDYKGQKIVVSHIPFCADGIDFINVHGHIHQYEPEFEHQINISVEATNYKPVCLKELLDKFIESKN
jgi:calcineurin-like phosphoesterase family protein